MLFSLPPPPTIENHVFHFIFFSCDKRTAFHFPLNESREVLHARDEPLLDATTKRKNALKQLAELLQSGDFASVLDATTKKLDSGRGGDVKHSWAGLTGSVMLCVVAEMHSSHGKKRGVDKSVTSILRKLVAAAEDSKRKIRAGVTAPLRWGEGGEVGDGATVNELVEPRRLKALWCQKNRLNPVF